MLRERQVLQLQISITDRTTACGIASLVASKTAFTCTDKGENTVTLTVTDNHGNVSTCNATVTVQDNMKPTFTFCPAAKSVNTNPSKCNYTVIDNSWDATANDNCLVSSLTYSANNGASPATGNTLQNTVFQKGITTVTWTATDGSGNSQTCVFAVTVVDNELPVANCKAFTAQIGRDGTVTVNPSDIDNTSADNCGITSYLISKDNVTYSSSLIYNCDEIGSPAIYLKVTDAAENTTTCSSTLTVTDTQAPTLDDIADREETTDAGGCTFTYSGIGWDPTDNCGMVTSMTYTLSGATTTVTSPNTTLDGQIFEKGTTVVTWNATDDHGNTGTTSFNVVVTDNQNPTIACPDNIIQTVSNKGDLTVLVTGIASPTTDDNCSVTKLTYTLSGATTLSSPATGINNLNNGTFNLGTTTVTYVVYDAAGNSATCSFTVRVDARPDDVVTITGDPITTYEDQSKSAATFKVKLPSAPTGNVVLDVTTTLATSGNGTAEGNPVTTQLTFNASNWNIDQTVSIKGADEFIDDGDQAYSVLLTINQGAGKTDVGSGYYNAGATTVAATNIDNDVAGVTVSPTTITTTEAGGTATFTIVLTSQPVNDVTFTLSTSDATEGDVTSSKTITFTSGAGSNWNVPQTVTVKGADDLFADGNVVYTIITSDATSTDPLYTGMVAADVTATNTDNDTPGIDVVQISSVTSENASTASFKVRLKSQPATDSRLTDVVVINVSSNNTNEGTVGTSTLTFDKDNWNIYQEVTVTGVNEPVTQIVDGTISYAAVLTVDRTNTTDLVYKVPAKVPDPANVNFTNTDNDAATLAINNVSQLEGNSGTSNFTFTVTHSGAQVSAPYTVTWYTQNYSPTEASFPSDYAGSGGTLNFDGSVGEEKTVSIVVNGDTKVEPNERFKVVLNSVSAGGKNVTIPTAGKTGTGTIQNEDNASFSIDDVSIVEGNSGSSSLDFTVTLSEDIEAPNPITVDYATSDGTALSGEDYTTASGTLSFVGTKGETKTISVPILGDTKIELDETFTVTLSNIKSSGLDAAILNTITILDGTGVGTISNDDVATVSIDNVTHNEGNSGTTTYNFTVTLSKPSDADVKVDYATSDGTATTADGDYTGISTTTLIFAPGETSKTVTVQVNGDSKVELHETFAVNLSNLVNNGRSITLPAATQTGTGTITNDDSATLSIDDKSVDESAGTATFTVTLTGDIQEAVSFNYAAANISPISASDYSLTSGSITFPAGSTTGAKKTIDVTILDDYIAEPTETYHINLDGLNASGQTNVSFSDSQGLGTILDDDIVHLTLNGFTITETNGTQTANFYVSRDIASQATITLKFSTSNGSAVSGSDYTSQSNVTVTMTAGSTSSINVPVTTILGGTIAEPQEAFNGTITLNSSNGQQVVISTATATSTINDDDIVHITLADKTVTETDATQIVNYQATTDIQAQYPIVLSFSTSDGSAINGNDYTSQSGTTVTIPALTTSVNIPIDVLGDLVTEPQETYTGTVSLTSSNTQQPVVLSKSTATYTINDNDPATLVVSGFTVNESAGTGNFTVTLNRSVQNAFTVDFATSNITASAGSDYTAVGTTTLNFGATNLLVQTITVNITDDDLVEPTETLLGTISNLVANSQSVTITTSTATGTITDNDQYTIAINDVEVAENAGSAVFTVTLTGHIQDQITLNYTTAKATATDLDPQKDYLTTSGVLTFPAGSGSVLPYKTTLDITVPIVNDAITEPTENYTVDLSGISSSGTASSVDSQGLGTITDDDLSTLISLSSIPATEGNTGTAPLNFVATMNRTAQEPVILKFSTTPGAALAGSDFIAQTDVEYTILPGNLSVTIPVQVIGDLIVEPEETFTGEITLVNANGQSVAVDPTNKTATGKITDNDQATFTISGFDKNEADGTGIFTISVDKEIQDEITVDFATSDGTAKAGLGLDYTAIGITPLHFGDGNLNSQTVSVTINDDDWVEPTEILNGVLGNLNSNNQDVILTGGGATASATGTINDNDAAAISIDDMSVNEADGKAIFTVTLSGNIQDDLTVDYITNDASAIAGSDYTSISGTTTFAGGSLSGTQHTIEVPILNDEVAEPKETYAVDLKDLICTGSSSFGDNQGLGTILDNDPMTLALSGFEITETEAAQTSYFVVTSNISAQKDIEITFTTTDISATSSSDYTAQSAHTYILVAGQKTWNIPVEILGDAIAEPIETFTGTIALSNDNAQQVTIPVAGETATSTIYDNDAIVINLSGFIVTETESTQNKDFTVSLNTSAQYDIVLNFSTSDGTTQAGNDFTAQSGTLVTIPHGSTVQCNHSCGSTWR